MIGRCSGVLGTVCASYPTSKEQRESENIPQLSWKGTGCLEWRHSRHPCTASSVASAPGNGVRALSLLLKGWMLLSTLFNTSLRCCTTRLGPVSARELKAGNEWGSRVLLCSFFLQQPYPPLPSCALFCENEWNLSLAGYTNIFKCYLWFLMGNTILAQLDMLMRTNDVCFT